MHPCIYCHLHGQASSALVLEIAEDTLPRQNGQQLNDHKVT